MYHQIQLCTMLEKFENDTLLLEKQNSFDIAERLFV